MDNDPDNDDYKVGYGKPPKEHRFKKGNKAAAGRRKSKHRQKTEAIFAKLLGEKLTVTLEGKKVRMTWKEAILRSLISESRKSTRDMFRLLELMEKYQIDLFDSGPGEDSMHKILVEFVGEPVEPVYDTCSNDKMSEPRRRGSG